MIVQDGQASGEQDKAFQASTQVQTVCVKLSIGDTCATRYFEGKLAVIAC